jgi:hypothetical protein
MTKATTETITLETPITRGEQVITKVELRKPFAGELRGVSLMDLMRMEVQTSITLLPRITNPSLTAHDVEGMDPVDLLQMATTVTGFLLPKSVKTESSSALKAPTPTLQ